MLFCSCAIHPHDNGLTIGISVHELLAVMGTPKASVNGTYEFAYSRSVTPAVGVPYDIDATLKVETESGRVTRLRAWYSETT
jgi:hypothetical protein